jgi:hypothetical protein
MKQYKKDKTSVWYDKENREIGIQLHVHGCDAIAFMKGDKAVVIFALLQAALEEYFNDYPPEAGKTTAPKKKRGGGEDADEKA